MPFNRVGNAKATLMFLLMLNEQGSSQNLTIDDSAIKASKDKIRWYVPGLMLIPIPQACWIAGYIDMAFWAVFLYVIGSVAYVVDSFYLWSLTYNNVGDDSMNPGNVWNTLGALFFVVNALVCFWDWWLQEGQLSATNAAANSKSGDVVLEEIPHKMSVYYFYNNLFFLGAAVVYMIQAIWLENINTDIYNCSLGL